MENDYVEKFSPFGNLTAQQHAAAELKALQPNVTNMMIAEQINVSRKTIDRWFKQPKIIDACYDRFMEVAGARLPNVLDAMIREAEEGSVPAAQLVLKHWGKLQEAVHIKIDSPFEKFLKLTPAEFEVIDADMVERSDPLPMVEAVASLPITESLPERNPNNDSPHARVYRQNRRLRKSITFARKEAGKHESYKLRMRAENVGMEPLSIGRPKKHVRNQWIKEIERRELEARQSYKSKV